MKADALKTQLSPIPNEVKDFIPGHLNYEIQMVSANVYNFNFQNCANLIVEVNHNPQTHESEINVSLNFLNLKQFNFKEKAQSLKKAIEETADTLKTKLFSACYDLGLLS